MPKPKHKCVDKAGNLCIDALAKDWSPATTAAATLLSVQALLAHPQDFDIDEDCSAMEDGQAVEAGWVWDHSD